MATLFQTLANEINADWTNNYKAVATENSLTVKGLTYTEDNTETWEDVAGIKSDLSVWGDDLDATEQLEYMLTR